MCNNCLFNIHPFKTYTVFFTDSIIHSARFINNNRILYTCITNLVVVILNRSV